MKLVLFLIICASSFNMYSQSNEEPFTMKFNRVYVFVPATPIREIKREVKEISTEVTFDLEWMTIKILTYDSNPPKEQFYLIESKDNINNIKYKFVCSEYTYLNREVIIEVNISDPSNVIITREVSKDRTSHKFYNE